MSIILIADDSKFMRCFLKNKLQQQRPLTFVEASDGQEAIDIYKLIKPDVTFLDITMPKVNGLTALR
ncbi:response regulator [Virgibacillus halodenitrificans]|uniref:response regulator n=1 Tax=Virgibacillus halodenitrificans TaxID=1482 RepID=UPI0030B9022F